MNGFNEAMVKTKVDNIFVKLHIGIMKQDLKDVDHFIGDDLYNNLQKKINSLKIQNKRQMYDELNVKNTRILNRRETDEKEIIDVEIISRYMDYIIDINTGNTLYGDDTRRVEKVNILTFEKRKNTKEIKIIRKCPTCGASMDVNNSGECKFCRTIFNQEDYDYVLVSMQTM